MARVAAVHARIGEEDGDVHLLAFALGLAEFAAVAQADAAHGEQVDDSLYLAGPTFQPHDHGIVDVRPGGDEGGTEFGDLGDQGLQSGVQAGAAGHSSPSSRSASARSSPLADCAVTSTRACTRSPHLGTAAGRSSAAAGEEAEPAA
ncbi:hypothetical protein ITP53_15145 [Nonomuraea sp. K274]|uniref:Uncharacterized protein n=1 Tax=Nonomuraea cypriaca TaxID=1187855 RepID=A0A931A8B6_9ACTN|nr:hypothetical protein [Nonomuraea cypriaca]MBF8187048.1 hypothetical protein [Nonomuraea cypriaca]